MWLSGLDMRAKIEGPPAFRSKPTEQDGSAGAMLQPLCALGCSACMTPLRLLSW